MNYKNKNNRIALKFKQCKTENRKALVTFISVGCPDLATSEKVADSLLSSGADILELGVPFSDPMADGPVIQEASCRALENGTTLSDVLALARKIRQKHPDAPLILFSYYNVVMHYGVEALAADCKQAGIDGWLIVDVPFEECGEILPALKNNGLAMIPLIAPTTPPERAAKILANAGGFVYYITVTGVTGVRAEAAANIDTKITELKHLTPLPVVAGFGISSAETARKTAATADGAVVGSAIIKTILNNELTPEKMAIETGRLAKEISQALT